MALGGAHDASSRYLCPRNCFLNFAGTAIYVDFRRTFQKQAEKFWSEAERHAFIDWIAEHPLAGDVIKGANVARKVRWTVSGRGKSGGVRVIYFNLNEQGVVVLVMMYTKSNRATVLPTDIEKGA